jgi:hypothetical protein
VHRALTEADAEEAHPGASKERADAEQAPREAPAVPEEAVLAEEALLEDRRLLGGTVDDRTGRA